MCVTHLAQVAALADTQIMVSKTICQERHDGDGCRVDGTDESTRSPAC
jgi:DNA repair ATPase RecN